MSSDVICSINKGYQFFTKWIDQILLNNPDFEHGGATQKKFLAWQTFDLLRIDVYGIRAFCKHFLDKHPRYYISPMHLSGSAVESLFGQFKYSSGGKLDAANYSIARATCMVKQVVADHHSGKVIETRNFKYPICHFRRKYITRRMLLKNNY
uniref:Uncharacterized protein n=1 Tax=Amphimedon queenslandica TaxID=400682 RepID=A0A1X7UVZ7_AMPQE